MNNIEVQVDLGDITNERSDAIVNAANGLLAHSGGVAAAILRGGGGEIMRESSNIIATRGPVNVGQCVYTSAGNLKERGVKYVIHTVGPEYDKNRSELFNAKILYDAIHNPLVMAN